MDQKQIDDHVKRVKEKLLGGVRAGIREFILPRDNEAHLDDLTRAVREMITVHLVEELDEVMDLALRDESAGPGAEAKGRTRGSTGPARKKSTKARKSAKKA